MPAVVPFIPAIVAGAGALLGAKSSRDATKSAKEQQQAAIEAGKMDPRAEKIIYGEEGGDGGLLGQYQALGQKPQNQQLQDYGQTNLNWLSTAGDDMRTIRDTGNSLINGQSAPQAQAAQTQTTVLGGPNAYAVGNMVDAPAQNDINLKGAYEGFINGERGNNPYLTGAIGKGINQSKNAFDRMQDDSTRNLTENIMPGIRSNSVLAGQYGGSRQGIAEGRAIGDFGREQQRAISQFGQNNTDAAVAAQAGAYETDSNRALSATQGLGAQQYGVAQQDAATKNAAEFMNVGRVNDNQAATAAMGQQTNLANLGTQQQTNLANLGANQQTNQLNQSGKLVGTGLLSGQLSGAYGVGQNQDGYALNQASQVNSLLSPYLNKNGNSAVAQPLYSNTGAGLLGGAAAGLGMYNMYKQANMPQQQPYGGAIGNTSQPYGSNGVF